MKQSGQLVSHFGKFPGPKAFKKYIICHVIVSVLLLYVYYQLNGGKFVSMIKCQVTINKYTGNMTNTVLKFKY